MQLDPIHRSTEGGRDARGDGPARSHAGEADFDAAKHRPSRAGLLIAATLAGLLLVGLTLAGVVPRLTGRAAAREEEARGQGELARVTVVLPTRAAMGNGVTLPGSIQPVQETIVYARTNGYVRKYQVDLGDRVKAGQVLAEIDAPEVDQELRQAQAAANQARALVEQAKTQLELARTENSRYTSLRPTGVVSQQESDEHQARFDAQGANVQAAEAALGSAEANVHRLRELKSFATVTSPFGGVITSRTIELGQLVTAGTGQGQALFKVAKTDVMRVFVNVPQLFAPSVRVGEETTVIVREFPGHPFKATIARTANELDSTTRSLLTEVRTPNADGALIAGMYAQVTLPVLRADAPLLVPSTALVVDSEGTRVVVVDGGTIRWRKVNVDSDMGDKVAIASGLSEGDAVVVIPSDRLTEGLKVRADPPPVTSAGR
jgi:RND family efflux transporter MFP subunit